MNPHETLQQLTEMRSKGQSADIDAILSFAIERIENVLDVECEMADWSADMDKRIARINAYGVPAFLTAA